MVKPPKKLDADIRRWPADKVERRAVSLLVGNIHNTRKHSEKHIRAIARSIEEWGFTVPVLVDEGGQIIAGHGRVLAAQRLKLTEVPVMVAAGWTALQKRAYLIADNKLTEAGEWDQDALIAELERLRSEDFDIGLTGFSDDELDNALARASEAVGGVDPNSAPERPESPVTRRGDLWLLGAHRVLCGDATNREDVAMLFGGAAPNLMATDQSPEVDLPDLMATDPPYGVEYDPTWRDGADLGVGERSKGKVQNDDCVDWREAWSLFPGQVAYVWHAGVHAAAVQLSLEACGFTIRSQIIWAKQHFVMSRGDYHWQHEPCWYAVRERGKWAGDRKQTTLWEIKNNNSFGNQGHEKTWGHGTQKPVECMLRPILNNSAPGDSVYDPFVGSGTTVIAAQQSGRRAYAMEIDQGYVDVVVQRWQEFTGQAAVLQGDGRSFAEIALERALKTGENSAKKGVKKLKVLKI